MGDQKRGSVFELFGLQPPFCRTIPTRTRQRSVSRPENGFNLKLVVRSSALEHPVR